MEYHDNHGHHFQNSFGFRCTIVNAAFFPSHTWRIEVLVHRFVWCGYQHKHKIMRNKLISQVFGGFLHQRLYTQALGLFRLQFAFLSTPCVLGYFSICGVIILAYECQNWTCRAEGAKAYTKLVHCAHEYRFGSKHGTHPSLITLSKLYPSFTTDESFAFLLPFFDPQNSASRDTATLRWLGGMDA